MKKNICAAIDVEVFDAVTKFCSFTKDGVVYNRSKSALVNESLKEYLIKRGVKVLAQV